MPLTDAAIRKLKSVTKARKVADERGMYLLVTPTGAKLWRLKYRIAGKEKLLAIGSYPDVGLADAREKRDAARKLIAAGIDPSDRKRADRDAAREARQGTFGIVAEEWFAEQAKVWVPRHAETVRQRLDQYLIPKLGKRVLREITAPEVLKVFKEIEARGTHETARRVRQIYAQVARYGVASGRAESDVSRDVIDALAPVVTQHRAAITDPKEAAGLLRAIDTYKGGIVVKCALRLAPLVFVRPGELRQAEWVEINFMKAQWEIPAEKMKMKQPLIVPLSTQALAILREVYAVTGHGRFVFPSPRTGERPMSDNAILSALRRMGVDSDEMTGHGFRALARTIMDEVLHFRVDLIETQLGHAVKDPNGRAYNRTSFLAERTDMMQSWADYLDQLKEADGAATKRA